MLCYQVEKKAELLDLTDELKETVKTTVESCRNTLQSDDLTNLQSEYEQLQQVYAQVMGQTKSDA
jgi:gas vesicle protein